MSANTTAHTFPIAEAAVHYGFPTVWLAEEVTTTDRHGDRVVIDEFYLNGGTIRAAGWKFRKNGERAARKLQSLEVKASPEIIAALDALEVAR